MNWISVEEKVPPVNHEVLYFAKNEVGTKEIMTGHRTKEGCWTHCCLFYSAMTLNDKVTVTHWMELPDYPPTEPCPHTITKRIHLDQLGLMDICEACSRAIPFGITPEEAGKKFIKNNQELLKRLADR